MNIVQYVFFSLSSIVAGMILAVRYKQIDARYHPFAFLIWIGVLNDSLSFCLMLNGFQSLINNNIYVLFESLLIAWFLNRLGDFGSVSLKFFAALLSIVWLSEAVTRSIYQLLIYFRIVYSFIVVLLSINMVNKLLITERKSILNNASFLITGAFIIFFSIKALVYSFWVYGIGTRGTFLASIQKIMVYLNLITNLLYAFAALWIPKKQISILPS